MIAGKVCQAGVPQQIVINHIRQNHATTEYRSNDSQNIHNKNLYIYQEQEIA